MCKSSSEPGGPYRCSGDMHKARVKANTDAVTARVETDRAKTRHDLAVEALESLEHSASGSVDHDERVSAARALELETRLDLRRANTRLALARSKALRASAAYDATPRGLGELRLDLEDAYALNDRQVITATETRLQTAMERVRREESQRKSNGERLGAPRGNIEFKPMGSDAADPADTPQWRALIAEVNSDRISGCSKVRLIEPESATGPAVYEHKVTLTYTTSLETKTATFTRNTPDPQPPSTTETIGEVVANAGSVQPTNSSARSSDRNDADRLVWLVGKSRFQQYVDVWNNN